MDLGYGNCGQGQQGGSYVLISNIVINKSISNTFTNSGLLEYILVDENKKIKML